MHFPSAAESALVAGASDVVPSARALFHTLMQGDASAERHARAWAWLASHGLFQPHPELPKGAPAPPTSPSTEFGIERELREWSCLARTWAASESAGLRADVAELDRYAQIAVLRRAQPAVAVDGCWLKFSCQAQHAYEPQAALLLRSYVHRLGRLVDPQAAPGPRERWNALATEWSVQSAPPTSWTFIADIALPDVAFEAPAVALALAHCASGCLPETLGFNLAYAAWGGQPLLDVVTGTEPHRVSTSVMLDEAVEAVAVAMRQHADADTFWWGTVRGIALGLRMLHLQVNELRAEIADGSLSPRGAMLALVRRKARNALGYHAQVEPLETLFADTESQPEALLDALLVHGYVRAGFPERSRLLKASLDPRGRMTGIFDTDEQAVIRRWILSLGEQPADARKVGATFVAKNALLTAAAVPLRPAETCGQLSQSPRNLYHALLHADTHPEVWAHAGEFVAAWLSRVGHGLDNDGPLALPLPRYTPAGLADWLQHAHHMQIGTYRKQQGQDLPPRDMLIETCVQMAPAVFIDGCWLQHTADVGFCGTPIGQRLFTILIDELGRGAVTENHANLYRELLAAMEVELPVFGTEAFAHWSGFRDDTFAAPAFWLALSFHSRRFLPELLGLNLAIELSSVGSAYRSISDALRHHGFPSTFVDVHNTVDNVCTGHTSLALQAVQLYLDEVLQHSGAEEVEGRWHRVWTGYHSLAPPTTQVA